MIIVGAGVSAVQLLDEISHVAETVWMTRREPQWVEEDFDVPARTAAIAGVEARVRQGLPPGSVIAVTGMHWTPWARAAQERGVLVRHPMFASIEEHGVRMPDGSFIAADVILWATGFRPALDHLAPLKLRTPDGRLPRGRHALARRAAAVPDRLRALAVHGRRQPGRACRGAADRGRAGGDAHRARRARTVAA